MKRALISLLVGLVLVFSVLYLSRTQKEAMLAKENCVLYEKYPQDVAFVVWTPEGHVFVTPFHREAYTCEIGGPPYIMLLK